MARDLRKLREEAAEATASGKHKRALAAYLELERYDNDAQWSKRVAETYRRLGKDRDAIDAFKRSADRYAQGGFLVQAIAVCKLILQIDPKNDDALHRISMINEQIGAGPTRAVVMAEGNPALESSVVVTALRNRSITGLQQPVPSGQPHQRRPKISSVPPTAIGRTITPREVAAAALHNIAMPRTMTPQGDIVMARTKSRPISLPPGSALDIVQLAEQVENSYERVEKSGIYVIPLDDEPPPLELLDESEEPYVETVEASSAIDLAPIEVEAPSGTFELPPEHVEEVDELELEDLEEIPLPAPRAVGAAAAAALAATPFFAGMPSEALEALVSKLDLIELFRGDTLFREGDPGDALYVIVEGEVAVQAEGPPRVEMARLSAGAFIGEVALMTDQPRSATVTATQDSQLLRIDRPTLSHVLATRGEVLASVLRFVRDRLVDRWTRTSPLFRPFTEGERAALAGRFKFLEVQPGSMLIQASTKPDGLYIVLAGKFEVRRKGQAVAVVGPGELIGETALLSGGNFQSDVVSRGKSLALCLPAGEFREVIMTHPHVLEYIGEQAEQSRKLHIL